MSETETNFIIADYDGDKYKLKLTHRYCGCGAPGCVDDEIAIDVDQDGVMYTLQIPRDMTRFIEGLLTGEYKSEIVYDK